MSDLTEALNRIYNWLQQNDWSRYQDASNSAPSLKPGLSRAEIDSIIGSSNLELPEEVYELYQWRNSDLINNWDYVGLFDIAYNFTRFIPWGFVPFQSVVNNYIYRNNYYSQMEPEIYKRLSAFPNLSNFQNPMALKLFCYVESCSIGYVNNDSCLIDSVSASTKIIR